MEVLETYRYPQFKLPVVYAAKFKGVTNAATVRSRIVNAASMESPEGEIEREAVNFAFINAKLVTSPIHLQTAIYQALLSESQGLLRTKTIHSEIIWALNPTNNITEAIRRYGVSDTSTDLIIVRVATSDYPGVLQDMRDVVEGELDSLANISETTDWSSVRKHYKLNAEPAVKDAVGDASKERVAIDNIVVSSVAMKSVMA
ncbi:kinase binding protein CGI-121-domain-containing protein [Melanogaster broomeanus]|nr:kinase binding protein CGI-121-domain-containing protein [Melanogaster broomeanus]